jgi:hypothetical protein
VCGNPKCRKEYERRGELSQAITTSQALVQISRALGLRGKLTLATKALPTEPGTADPSLDRNDRETGASPPLDAVIAEACKQRPSLGSPAEFKRGKNFREQLQQICTEYQIRTNWIKGEAAVASRHGAAGGGGELTCGACMSAISQTKLWVCPQNVEVNFPWSYVPLEELRAAGKMGSGASGADGHPYVDSTRKERYLSPEDLRVAFRQEGVESLQQFYAMPRWKQKRAKLRTGIWHDYAEQEEDEE